MYKLTKKNYSIPLLTIRLTAIIIVYQSVCQNCIGQNKTELLLIYCPIQLSIYTRRMQSGTVAISCKQASIEGVPLVCILKCIHNVSS